MAKPIITLRHAAEKQFYYHPKIEDLYVGYELYIRTYDETDKLVKHVITKPNDIDSIADVVIRSDREQEYTLGSAIYTKFLTEQQIRLEGWKDISCILDFSNDHNYPESTTFEKGNYWLTFARDTMHIEIIAKDPTKVQFMRASFENFRVTLPCYSINEFRKIIKLLDIND